MGEVEIFRLDFDNKFEAGELRLHEKTGSRKAKTDGLDGGTDNAKVAPGDASSIEGRKESTVDPIPCRGDHERVERVLLEELHLKVKSA